MTTCHKHPNSERTPSGKCRQCNKEYQRKWYENNKELQNKRSRESTNRARQRKREFVYAYLLAHECIVCGESDPVVLQFDHIEPKTKSERISKMIFSSSYKLEDIKKEINKCQILCANCHARKTAKDFNWYSGLDHIQAGVSPHSYKV